MTNKGDGENNQSEINRSEWRNTRRFKDLMNDCMRIGQVKENETNYHNSYIFKFFPYFSSLS